MTASREADWAMWLRSAIAGDSAAYRLFLESVTPHIRAVARSRCRTLGASESEVEDIVQEVLLAIHLKRGTWDMSRPVGPWVSTITRNKLIDVLRRRGRHINVPIEDVAEMLPADEAPSELAAHDVDVMLSHLKTQQREIVREISLNGTSVRETANRLQMSEVAVRVTLHRALKALSAIYSERKK